MFNQKLETQLKQEIRHSKKTGILDWKQGIEKALKNQAMLEVIRRLAKC